MSKKYKCPYCDKRYEREKLITHIESHHEDMIPEGQTATQVVFNSINKKTHGTCVVCKKPTKWNEKAGRYDRLCGNPKCREKLREEFKSNSLAKHGTYNFAADTDFQEKMLKGRKISSSYKFADGGKVDYVGSYERKFLEFIDKVMNIESKDIIGPGPVIEYEYNGEIHNWITDFYYVPGNLVLDIKDGGKNPNKRPMEEYREKQIAKEAAIRKLKKYNYLRLTDNNFAQFLEVLTDLKYMALDMNQEKHTITRINEDTIIKELSAGLSVPPPLYSFDASVVMATDNNGDEKMALSSLDFNDSILIDDENEGIKKISKKDFNENYTVKDQFVYHKDEKYFNLLEAFKNNSVDIYNGIYNNLSSFDNVLVNEQIYFDDKFKKINMENKLSKLTKDLKNINESIEVIDNNVLIRNDKLCLPNIIETAQVKNGLTKIHNLSNDKTGSSLREFNKSRNANFDNVYVGGERNNLSMSQEDGYDSILKMFPEFLDIKKLEQIKEDVNFFSDTIVKVYKDYVYGEIYRIGSKYEFELAKCKNLSISIDNTVSEFPGILAWMSSEIRDLIVYNNLSEEAVKNYILGTYFPDSIEDPDQVRAMINSRLKYNKSMIKILQTMLKVNYTVLDIEKAEAECRINQLLNDESGGISEIRKLIARNSSKFIKNNSYFDFRSIGGGIVYGTDNFKDMERYMKPERVFLYAFQYDCVVFCHGDSQIDSMGNKYMMSQPVRTLSGKVYDFVPDLLRELINVEHHKNILLLQCNPGNLTLPSSFLDEFPDDVTITFSRSTAMTESTVIKNNIDYPESILEAEQNLIDICNENGIDYNDTEFLEESYNYITSNLEVIQEVNIIELAKTLVKKLLSAIVYIWKKMVEFFKKIYSIIVGFFHSIKNSKVALTIGDIKTSYITLEAASVKDIKAKNIDELEKRIKRSCDSISKEIKKRSNEQVKCTQLLKRGIDSGKIKIYNESSIEESNNEKYRTSTLIFDLGGVLVQNYDFQQALKESKYIPADHVDEIFREWMKISKDSEFYTLEDFRSKFEETGYGEYFDDITDIIVDNFKLFNYTEKLLQTLKKGNYEIYYLSNWSAWSVELLRNNHKFDFLKYFNGGVFSCFAKYEKPSVYIYEKLLSEYNLLERDSNGIRRRLYFFDDKQENIDMAYNIGMIGIPFTPDRTVSWIYDRFLPGTKNPYENDNKSFINEFYNELKVELENSDEFFMITPSNDNDELDKQFEKFNAQTDDQKEKADIRSLALYGITNYDHYYKLISSNNGTVEESAELSFSSNFLKELNCESNSDLINKIQKIKTNVNNMTNCIVIYPINNVNELSNLYMRYMALDKDHKLLSDEKCKEFFGKTNRELYKFIQDSNEFKNIENNVRDKELINVDSRNTDTTVKFNNDTPLLTPEELEQEVTEDYSCFNDEDAKIIKAWRESYIQTGYGIIDKDYRSLNLSRLDILRRSIYENNIDAIIQCGWIPGIDFNSNNRVKASNIVKDKVNSINFEILDYNCIKESSDDNDDKKAVSIILVSGNSLLGKTIKKVQGIDFSHASISLDDDLKRIYSFNKRNKFDGFSYESMKQYVKEGVDKVAVYTFLVTDSTYKKLENILDNFSLYRNKTKYSILNLFTIPFNINLDLNMKMVCSEFVDKLLKLVNIDLSGKKSSLVSPKDLYKKVTSGDKNIVEVFNGSPENYNHDEIKKRIQKVKRSNIKPYSESTEYITEAKSFPIQIDKDGNLIIKNIKKIDFEQEYSNSHRLLMEYEKSKSYEQMKFELAKLHFLIELMEKKIYKKNNKDLINTRARYLNDYKKYLQLVIKNDNKFNFSEYYQDSPFNDAMIQIDNNTLKYGWKALKYIIK